MGWWDCSIMGGDSPLDIEGDWEDEFGEQVVSSNDAIKFILKLQDAWGGARAITQVVGFLMIQGKMPINDQLRALIIEACDPDEWADDDEERKKVIDEFRTLVMNYKDGEEVTMPHQPGLFEKINDAMSKGKVGLINVNT